MSSEPWTAGLDHATYDGMVEVLSSREPSLVGVFAAGRQGRQATGPLSASREACPGLTLGGLPQRREGVHFDMPQSPRTSEARAFLVAFGLRVRQIRLERRLSQEALGELAGIDRQTINRLENAAHALSTAHLGPLARALGVAPRELMPEDASSAAPVVR